MTTGKLKEESIRTILRNLRSEGHPYVELRQDGNKLIFFCVLCLMPCYGDSNLYNHLKGKRHTERLAAAKCTLMKTNPWPFNDGRFFFHDDSEENLPVSGSKRIKFLDNLANISYDKNLVQINANSRFPELVIPGVQQKHKVSDLVVRLMGVGLIGARFSEKDEASNEIRKIWCEWLGSKALTNVVPEHDFAVVTFACKYNLLTSSEAKNSASKKRKSFSDSEDISGKLLSKTMMKNLMPCDICQQKMLPDKDVACLLNKRTGKLVCSSRNVNGLFHMFHVSCLIHWILHCEVEIYKNQSADTKVERKSRKKVKNQIYSALCPECQGTGVTIDAGEALEKPLVSLSKIFNIKIELCDAYKAWRKNPEVLQNCSLGFSFPLHSDEIYKENVVSLKLLKFYRAQISG